MITSLLHLVGLRPRVYYTLTNFRGGGAGACPGIRKRGGPKSESLFFFFFFAFHFFRGGGPAQKLAEKKTFSTRKVAKYRWNSLIFALMTFFYLFIFIYFFFCFSISRGGGPRPLGPPLDTRLGEQGPLAPPPSIRQWTCYGDLCCAPGFSYNL